jgi:ATP-binding cassette subfamily F protein 3
MAAIDSYPGAIIMVTHNELFLHSLANRFIVFQESGVRVFEGSYQYFLDKIGWEEEKSDQGKSFNQKDTLNKKDLRKLRSEIITRRNREIKPLEEKLVKTENLITEKEEALSLKNKEIIEASGVKSGKEIESLSKEIHSLQKEINELFVQYEELHNTIEEKKRDFDLELSKLEE